MALRRSFPCGFIIQLIIAIFLTSPAAWAETRIGIVSFSEEVRYIEGVKGIRDQLKEDGYGEPATVFTIDNAGANQAKGAGLVRMFASAKYDLIFSLGTSITIPLAREIKDVPIVFSVVYDPVEAGIAKDWKSSGNNTTGSTTRLNMSLVLERLKTFGSVKRLAVLYTPAEKNSVLQLKDLQEVQAAHGIKIVPVPLTSKEEIVEIIPEVVRTSDALYLTGSNLVDSQMALIIDLAIRARVVTITHLEDLVDKGVLVGVCASMYKLGRLAGQKGVKILKGAKPASIPIESLDKLDVLINMKTAKQGKFDIPQSLRKDATRIIE